ncbi:TUB4 [Candida theae]|uniref:Tubulin gamma chain n=1 Tax=Candida theae TaxID=1198502 RepID=A0AAD5BFT7_9ASCO|nr:TUB4 [Candida theae]KAI5958577.1 TUB4 [Candida theae]
MPGETITIQAGQCGNQVGLQYWQQLASEHGINKDGTPTPYPQPQSHNGSFPDSQPDSQDSNSGNTTSSKRLYREDHPELFFTFSDSNTYTPRSVLIDLEPSVVTKALSTLPMLNPRSTHVSDHGNGAANNWSNGYKYGSEHIESILNLLDKEADKCDNLSQFQLFHSVAGGTGSGCGSKILEVLQDRYTSKKIITTNSIFPSNEKTSDVVVQPYNSLLTLQRLIEFSNATFVFHNDALNTIENTVFSQRGSLQDQRLSDATSFQGTNKLIAFVSASVSNPMRFPGYMYSSIESIVSSLVPTPDLKFLTTSVAPFSTQSHHNYINEYDMFLELSDDRYKTSGCVSTTSSSLASSSEIAYISLMNYLISGSKLDRNEIRKGILKVQARTNYVPWTSRSVGVVHGKKSPFVKDTNLEGIQISNNTSIIDVFNRILRQYDLLVKRKAYLSTYTEDNSAEELERVVDMFSECKESVVRVIDEYSASRGVNYLEDDDVEMDI